MAIIIMQQRLTAHLSWELPVERPKKRIIETKWQLARWPPTRARSEPEENIKLESGVGGRGRKPFNIIIYCVFRQNKPTYLGTNNPVGN